MFVLTLFEIGLELLMYLGGLLSPLLVIKLTARHRSQLVLHLGVLLSAALLLTTHWTVLVRMLTLLTPDPAHEVTEAQLDLAAGLASVIVYMPIMILSMLFVGLPLSVTLIAPLILLVIFQSTYYTRNLKRTFLYLHYALITILYGTLLLYPYVGWTQHTLITSLLLATTAYLLTRFQVKQTRELWAAREDYIATLIHQVIMTLSFIVAHLAMNAIMGWGDPHFLANFWTDLLLGLIVIWGARALLTPLAQNLADQLWRYIASWRLTRAAYHHFTQGVQDPTPYPFNPPLTEET